MLVKLGLIAAGGALGAVARYGLTEAVRAIAGSSFPWGTLAVNVLGCAAVGVFGAIAAGPAGVRDEYRALVVVGLLGGFTTFSAFGWETFQLLEARSFGPAAANALLNACVGVAAVFLGFRMAQHFVGSPA